MISVCMATYNGEKYIKEQIDSILSQLSEEDELIVSDDGSTDSTLEIINEYNDKRIKVFINSGEHGYTPNFENALMNAKGDYIFLSDQDDIWVQGKVSRVMEEFSKGYDFVYTDCKSINENREVISESRIDDFKIKKGAFRTLVKMRYIGCCCCFNRKLLEVCLPFPKKYLVLEHDAWIVSIANFYFKVSIIDDKLLLYRRHGNNTSDGGLGGKKNLIKLIYKRLYRLKFIIKRKKRL